MNVMSSQIDLEELTAKQIDLFSYASLSRADEASAREDAALIRSHVEDIAKKGVDIGQALARQKTKMPHGTFIAWVRDECRLSEGTAQAFMRAAANVEANPRLNEGLRGSRISIAAIDILFASGTPQPVRDKVEEMLVDGQKITVADIRRMKSEAKTAETRAEEAQQAVETLAARNAELVVAVQAPAAPPELDLEAIRAEGAKEAESRLTARMNELATANVKANDEAKLLRVELEKFKAQVSVNQLAANNVVKPAFGSGQSIDPDVDEFLGENGSISAFSGALGSMDGLDFDAAAFWKQQGKSGSHGKRIYQALLSVNATIGLLIKEYTK